MAPSLVIQLARFGDIVQTGRLIHALLRDGETHLCLDHSLVPLAKKFYPACHLHPIHAHGQASAHDVYTQNMASFTTLQNIPFKAVFNLNYAGINRALAYLFPPEILYGYTMHAKQHHKESWFRLAFRLMAKRRISPLNLTDLWGLLTPHPFPPAQVHPEATPKGGGLGIVLAGRSARRSLPPEILTTCIMALFERMDAPHITLLGTKQERPLAHQIMRMIKYPASRNITDLSGKTSLEELIQHVGSLDLLFTPDTGTMHLATALGVPVEAYFLSSAWAYDTGPYGLGHHIWQSTSPCAPCNEFAACPHERICTANFSDHAFLNHLAGHKYGALPPSLQKLSTGFDELGLVLHEKCHDTTPETSLKVLHEEISEHPTSTESEERTRMRNLIGSLAPTPINLGLSTPPIIQHFIHESDWILPNTRP